MDPEASCAALRLVQGPGGSTGHEVAQFWGQLAVGISKKKEELFGHRGLHGINIIPCLLKSFEVAGGHDF